MPALGIGLANPGAGNPVQKPALLPVIGPIPLGPVPSPNGIFTHLPLAMNTNHRDTPCHSRSTDN